MEIANRTLNSSAKEDARRTLLKLLVLSIYRRVEKPCERTVLSAVKVFVMYFAACLVRLSAFLILIYILKKHTHKFVI